MLQFKLAALKCPLLCAYCCLRARACPRASPLPLSVSQDIGWMCAIQIRSAWDASRGSWDVTIAVPLSEETPGCTWILFVVSWLEGNTMSFFQRMSRHSSSPERGGRFRRKLHLQCRNLSPSCAYKARVPWSGRSPSYPYRSRNRSSSEPRQSCLKGTPYHSSLRPITAQLRPEPGGSATGKH